MAKDAGDQREAKMENQPTEPTAEKIEKLCSVLSTYSALPFQERQSYFDMFSPRAKIALPPKRLRKYLQMFSYP